MYDDNFNELMKFIFKSEGGYSNHKNDPGGATNYGITQGVYDDWNKNQNLPLKKVKSITKEEALNIYYKEFWQKSGADKVRDLREAYILFDTAVNCGVDNAKRMHKRSGGDFYKFLQERKKYYDEIIKNNHKLECFRQGWYKRIQDLENNANVIVNSGLYIPPYHYERTIYDEEKEYEKLIHPSYIPNNQESLENIIKEEEIKNQNARNKYLYEKHQKHKQTGKVVTGGASSVYNTISNNSDDPLQLYTKNDNEKTSSQKLADGIDNDEWDDNDIAFLEAFLSDEKDKHLIKQAKEKRKQRVKDKGNKGKGPNGEDGYWYATKQGKHVFVPDDKTA